MPHDPKIEVYKIFIKRKAGTGSITFREFFRSKSSHYNDIIPAPTTDLEILTIHMSGFIKSIGLDKYKTDSRKKKAFTVGVEGNTTRVSIATDQMFIDGILYGGRYNAERILGKIDNTSDKSKITRDNIVSDSFYFLLYTPLNHREGIFIIQGYTESRISDIVKRHLKEYFSYYTEWSSQIEPFIPRQYRENFMKDAKFQKVVFSSTWKISDHDYEEITNKNEHTIQVKIEIIDQNIKKPDRKSIRDIVKWFGASSFRMKNDQPKQLEQFDYKDAKMESNGQSMSIDLESDDDDEDKVRPKITLSGNEYVTTNNTPNFNAIQSFCRNLLDEIIEEISPLNGIEEA
jgi:hypothetical protein